MIPERLHHAIPASALFVAAARIRSTVPVGVLFVVPARMRFMASMPPSFTVPSGLPPTTGAILRLVAPRALLVTSLVAPGARLFLLPWIPGFVLAERLLWLACNLLYVAPGVLSFRAWRMLSFVVARILFVAPPTLLLAPAIL